MHLKRELKVLLTQLRLNLLKLLLGLMHLKRELKAAVTREASSLIAIMHLKRELKDTPAIAFTHSLDTCI